MLIINRSVVVVCPRSVISFGIGDGCFEQRFSSKLRPFMRSEHIITPTLLGYLELNPVRSLSKLISINANTSLGS